MSDIKNLEVNTHKKLSMIGLPETTKILAYPVVESIWAASMSETVNLNW